MATPTYRDLDLNFTKHPITNDVSQTVNAEAVKRSVRNLLSLRAYEKPFHPEINSGIMDMMFEPIHPLYLERTKITIKTVIEKYEKRVNVLDLKLVYPQNSNEIYITITMEVVTLQTPITFTVKLVRNR